MPFGTRWRYLVVQSAWIHELLWLFLSRYTIASIHFLSFAIQIHVYIAIYFLCWQFFCLLVYPSFVLIFLFRSFIINSILLLYFIWLFITIFFGRVHFSGKKNCLIHFPAKNLLTHSDQLNDEWLQTKNDYKTGSKRYGKMSGHSCCLNWQRN